MRSNYRTDSLVVLSTLVSAGLSLCVAHQFREPVDITPTVRQNHAEIFSAVLETAQELSIRFTFYNKAEKVIGHQTSNGRIMYLREAYAYTNYILGKENPLKNFYPDLNRAKVEIYAFTPRNSAVKAGIMTFDCSKQQQDVQTVTCERATFSFKPLSTKKTT